MRACTCAPPVRVATSDGSGRIRMTMTSVFILISICAVGYALLCVIGLCFSAARADETARRDLRWRRRKRAR
jgi:hypothetical protein